MPPSRHSHGDPGRQGLLLKLAIALLLITGIAIFLVPAPLPKPIRIGIFVVDLIAALTLWLMGRQRFPR